MDLQRENYPRTCVSKELRLELVPKGFIASLEVKPTLMERIKERRLGDLGSKGKHEQSKRIP